MQINSCFFRCLTRNIFVAAVHIPGQKDIQHLNKDYASLCASHVPVRALRFGNALQTQLNRIEPSNRVSTTTDGNRHKNIKEHASRIYPISDRRSKPLLVKDHRWNSPMKPPQKPWKEITSDSDVYIEYFCIAHQERGPQEENI